MYDYSVRRVMQTIAGAHYRARHYGSFNDDEKNILEQLLFKLDIEISNDWVSLTPSGQEKLYELNGQNLECHRSSVGRAADL